MTAEGCFGGALRSWAELAPAALPPDERTEGLCRRPRSNGRPCRHRIAYVALGSCGAHLTATEKALRDAVATESDRALWLALDVPPVCWLWDVPATADRTTPERALTAWQAGRCAICGAAGEPLVEDHDHETGMARGWLCRSCNMREGSPTYRGDGPTVFTYYRRRPAAAVLGVSYRYISPLWGPDFGTGPPAVDRWRDNALSGIGL